MPQGGGGSFEFLPFLSDQRFDIFGYPLFFDIIVIGQKHFLGIDKIVSFVSGEFEFMSQKYSFLRAGLLAHAAEYTAQFIDFIDFGVADTVLRFGRFHIDAIDRTGGGAKTAANASFGVVVISCQIMQTSVSILQDGLVFGILLGNRFPEQISEGYGKSFGYRPKNRFQISPHNFQPLPFYKTKINAVIRIFNMPKGNRISQPNLMS